MHTHTHTHTNTHLHTQTHTHTECLLSIFINTHCTYKITWGISCLSQESAWILEVVFSLS